MEQTPNTPYQRSRRTDRAQYAPVETEIPAAPAQEVQPQQPVQQTQPVQPMRPMQPTQPVQQMQPLQPPMGYPAYQQSVRPDPYQPMPQGYPVYQQPVRPQQVPQGGSYPPQGSQAYPPVRAPYPQGNPGYQQPVRPYQPVQPPTYQMPKHVESRPVESSPARRMTVQYVDRAKLPQTPDAPVAQERKGRLPYQVKEKAPAVKPRREAPPEPATEENAAPQKAKPFPKWLSWALTLTVVVIMALYAAYMLQRAYLVRKEEERITAYQAILSNYHVTESEGRNVVTWQAIIEKYAAQYNLQPAFVTAIIRNESSFRTNAESGIGARGLMQMMPSTAEWIAGKLDDSHYDFDDMWDAETNIRYGCWYLGYLSDLFGGDPLLVACAYHAGQGEVRSWLGDRSISLDGKTVPMENIPIEETKTYAGRVTRAYGIYQTLLYPDAMPADGVGAAAVR